VRIVYKTGDLLDASERLILQGCNAQGRMKSGVAKAIRAKYPLVYRVYKGHYANHGLSLGELIWVDCGRHIVINAITQEHYGRDGARYVDYDAIRTVMTQLDVHPYFDSSSDKSIAMPLIGARLGGGEWSVIAQIIESSFTRVQPVVYTLDGIIHA
jgi:O-acetyl-ADP-ribose deacetylase (regulator of RNase III)